MSRKPLIVAVDCDNCKDGIILHGRGKEITVQWLEANLIEQGWVFSGDKDFCPKCKDESPAPKPSRPPKRVRKKRGKKKAGNRPPA